MYFAFYVFSVCGWGLLDRRHLCSHGLPGQQVRRRPGQPSLPKVLRGQGHGEPDNPFWSWNLGPSFPCLCGHTCGEFIQFFYLGLVVSICLDMLSIETLDIDISKTDTSTVEKILTVQILSLDSLKKDISISTVWKRTSRTRQFEKGHLDVSRHLDLDWSQLSRPSSLLLSQLIIFLMCHVRFDSLVCWHWHPDFSSVTDAQVECPKITGNLWKKTIILIRIKISLSCIIY